MANKNILIAVSVGRIDMCTLLFDKRENCRNKTKKHTQHNNRIKGSSSIVWLMSGTVLSCWLSIYRKKKLLPFVNSLLCLFLFVLFCRAFETKLCFLFSQVRTEFLFSSFTHTRHPPCVAQSLFGWRRIWLDRIIWSNFPSSPIFGLHSSLWHNCLFPL